MSIESFSGNYHWLSNFHQARVQYDGEWYPTVENAYQAAKTFKEERRQFKHCTPAMAKVHGRNKPLQWGSWDAAKVDIMRDLLKQKFIHGSYLACLLTHTGLQPLIEGNTWGDTFWGVCNGVGENMLGKLLMEIRGELFKRRPYTPADWEVGKWLSAALADPNVCTEMKADINNWFNSFEEEA